MSDTVPVKDGGLYKRRDGKVVRAKYNSRSEFFPGKTVFRMMDVRTGEFVSAGYCDGTRCAPTYHPGFDDIIKEITP